MRYLIILFALLAVGCNTQTYPEGATEQQIDAYNYAHPPQSRQEWMTRSNGDAGKQAVSFWSLPPTTEE